MPSREHDVDRRPDDPCGKNRRNGSFPFDESPVAADGCHDAVIAVAERFHRASFESGQQVFPQTFSWEIPTRASCGCPFGYSASSCIAAMSPIAKTSSYSLTRLKASTPIRPPRSFGLLSEARNGAAPDAARPDQVLGRDALPVVEDRAAVDIIGHFSVQHHFDAFALQGFQRFSRGLFRHGREQASQSFDQVDAHVRHVQPRVIPRHHVTSHFG